MAATDKLTAMSRALGAVYLSHKVDELERTAGGITKENNHHTPRRGGGGRGGDNISGRGGRGRGRGGGRPPTSPTTATNQNTPALARPRPTTDLYSPTNPKPIPFVSKPRDNSVADRIVVDASVLIHALKEVKRWCREDRKEQVIIPLEALNTLDLLKKGTSVLAMRARAASRVLEAQVGTNPRIVLQRDDAFVPWGAFADTFASSSPESARSDNATSDPPPDWLRHTICSAKWEADRGGRVVLAVMDAPPAHLRAATGPNYNKGPAIGNEENGKWERRADGDLARKWADKFGIPILSIQIPSSDSDVPNGSPSSPISMRGGGRGPSRGGHRNRRGDSYSEKDNGALVERVSTSPIRVLRVLARGEKLDP